ncbi:MAG: zinc-ribbon domain-containing protein [Christensenellales bacterium]
MFCFRCGQELPEGAKFCPSCGQSQTIDTQPAQAEAPKAEPQAEPVQAEAPKAEPQAELVQAEAPKAEPAQQPAPPQSGVSYAQTQPSPQAAPTYQTVPSPQPMQLGTKWLTVLPILLGLGAVLNLISIISLLDDLDGIPLSFAFSLPTIGPAFAIAFFSTIALIVLAVVAIILLVRRKKAGCFCVYALYAVQVLANIVVLFAYLDFGMDVLSIILSILIGAVMLAVNVVYFGKRKHMFS